MVCAFLCFLWVFFAEFLTYINPSFPFNGINLWPRAVLYKPHIREDFIRGIQHNRCGIYKIKTHVSLRKGNLLLMFNEPYNCLTILNIHELNKHILILKFKTVCDRVETFGGRLGLMISLLIRQHDPGASGPCHRSEFKPSSCYFPLG